MVVLLCEYLKFQIQLFKIVKYLVKRSICKVGTVCLSEKMWLPAVLLLTVVLTL